MRIETSVRTARKIYAGVFMMLLLGIFALVYWRSDSKDNSNADLQAPRGQISVTVQAANESTPVAADTAQQTATVSPDDSETQGFWYYVEVVKKLFYLIVLLSFLLWVGETAIRWIIKKERPKMCDLYIRPWTVPGWIWGKRWWKEEDGDNKDKSSSDDKKKKKSGDGVFGKWPAIIGAIIKYSLIALLVAFVIGVLSNPRPWLARVQQFNQSLTGTTIPAVTGLLASTAPDRNLQQVGLSPEQQNPRAISWVTTEYLPSKAGIVTTAPRSFKTDCIMSDETAFLIYMKDTTAGGEIIIKLRHNRSGELSGWWERIGGPAIKMDIRKPSWSATQMPDGSYFLRLQDSEIPTLFEELRIVRQ